MQDVVFCGCGKVEPVVSQRLQKGRVSFDMPTRLIRCRRLE